MAGLNKVMLIGNLGRDPEIRHTAGGQQVANFSIATSESFNDRNGQRQTRTEWHKLVVWGKLAEICAQYLRKGSQAYFEGRLQTRQWEDQQGQTKYTTEVVVRDMVMLGGRHNLAPLACRELLETMVAQLPRALEIGAVGVDGAHDGGAG